MALDAPVDRSPLIPFLKEPWTSNAKYLAILMETFLYGVYAVMFGCLAYFLARHKVVQRTVLAASTALFLLATGDVILTIFFFFRFVLQTPGAPGSQNDNTHEPWNQTLECKFALYILANAIANGLLIHRCYSVWRDRRVTFAPIVLVLCGIVISVASITASRLNDRLLAASFIMFAAASLSVTCLIATKLFSTACKLEGRTTIKFSSPWIMDLFASLLIDSGALYSLSIFLYLALRTLVLDASLTQIAGVTVTGMILRSSHSCATLGHTDATWIGPADTRPQFTQPDPLFPYADRSRPSLQ